MTIIKTGNNLNTMFVTKRNGKNEQVSFDKIQARINKLCYQLNMNFIDPAIIVIKVVNGLFPGVTTVELDNLAAEIAASMQSIHPDYGRLAARIFLSNLHKQTDKNFTGKSNNMDRIGVAYG